MLIAFLSYMIQIASAEGEVDADMYFFLLVIIEATISIRQVIVGLVVLYTLVLSLLILILVGKLHCFL